MQKFLNEPRIIKVDGEETYLLSYAITDNGIAITVSGPGVLYLHEHEVTEYNGKLLTIQSLRQERTA
jgi:hypothetical protein